MFGEATYGAWEPPEDTPDIRRGADTHTPETARYRPPTARSDETTHMGVFIGIASTATATRCVRVARIGHVRGG